MSRYEIPDFKLLSCVECGFEMFEVESGFYFCPICNQEQGFE